MAAISGDLKQWHTTTLDFTGPNRTEDAETFRDFRLTVTFTHEDGTEIAVPGFFAADGHTADTGSTGGDVWRVHFTPPKTGAWSYEVQFLTGQDVAVSLDAMPAGATSAGYMDGMTGQLPQIAESDATGLDLRAKGTLQYDGDQYLSFAGDGSIFLKSGVGSPENFLAFEGFDNTPNGQNVHAFAPHAALATDTDPSWGADGTSDGIIGAVNYLATQGVNSAYFMLMNVGGDGRDVWPWAAEDLDAIAKNAGNNSGSFNLTDDAHVFDVSKLAQWDIVFGHMQSQGINLHMFLQETENDQLLNDGDLGLERQLFIREMVARFGHHNSIIWNLGEETTNTDQQLRDHSAYLKALDPYDHPTALHTYPGGSHNQYLNFTGEETLDVLSFQTSNDRNPTPNYDKFFDAFEADGRPVVAFLDEPGSASVGLAAEGDPGWELNHDIMREALWETFTEGGSGVEWYFGYQTANRQGGDLAMEDFSLRESAYQWTAAARVFFEALPLPEMEDGDALVTNTAGTDHVLADPGEIYAIFLPEGGSGTLDLQGVTGTFSVQWYDPLTGGAFLDGTVTEVTGGGAVSLGLAPYETNRDWAVLVERTGDGDTGGGDTGDPGGDPGGPGAGDDDDAQSDPPPLQVTYQLVDAAADRVLDTLVDGAVIDAALVDGGDWTLVATPVGAFADAVESVRLTFDGTTQTESFAPYALFGDRNGDYSGSGKALQPGTYTLQTTYFADDGGAGTVLGTDTLSVTVAAAQVNQAPTPADDTLAQSLRVGESLTIAAVDLLANDTDPDGDAVRITGVEAVDPSDLDSLVLNGEDGSITIRPTVEAVGETVAFRYTVSDPDGAEATATATLAVENQAPIVPDQSFTLAEDTGFFEFVIFASAIGTDPEGQSLFFDGASGAQNGDVTFAGEGSILIYTPDPDFTGTETLTVLVSDRAGQGTEQTQATFTLTVTPVNDAPVAGDDTGIAATAGTALEIAVDALLANDTDVDGDPLSITAFGGSGDLDQLVLDGDRILVTPAADAAGPVAFTYTVADPDGVEDQALVTLDVSLAADGGGTGDEGTGSGGTGAVVFALNAGGVAATQDGIAYADDRTGSLVDGASRTYGDADGAVIDSERYGKTFGYDIDLADGTYDVTLQFAEIYWADAGKRVFDVAVEGEAAISDLDIYAEVGADTLLERTVQVEVMDGVLDIDFTTDRNNAKLSGLVVREAGADTDGTPPGTPEDDGPGDDLPVPDPVAGPPALAATYALVDPTDPDRVVELSDGAVLSADQFEGTDWGLTATPTGSLADRVESTKFTFGAYTRVENIEPYSLFGDTNGSIYDAEQAFAPGAYTLETAFFSGNRGGGDVLAEDTLSFTIQATIQAEDTLLIG